MPTFIEKRTDLSLGAKWLYSKLAQVAGEKDHCWPSQAWMAEKLGTTVRSIQNYLRELVRLGLIEVQRGRFGSTLKYYFVLNDIVELRGSSSVQVPSVTTEPSSTTCEKNSRGYENFSYVNNLNSNFKHPSLPSKTQKEVQSGLMGGGAIFSNGEDFEEVWKAWPEQVWAVVPENKHKALRVWESLRRNGELPLKEVLLDTIRRFKAEDVAWGRGYAPRLGNWLKAQRWKEAPRRGANGATTAEEPLSEAASAFEVIKNAFVQVREIWTKAHGHNEADATSASSEWCLACLKHGLPDMQAALESARTAFGVSMRSWIREFFNSNNMKSGAGNGGHNKQQAGAYAHREEKRMFCAG